jgi:hypothetical protein
VVSKPVRLAAQSGEAHLGVALVDLHRRFGHRVGVGHGRCPVRRNRHDVDQVGVVLPQGSHPVTQLDDGNLAGCGGNLEHRGRGG